jgi:hypothetical protein
VTARGHSGRRTSLRRRIGGWLLGAALSLLVNVSPAKADVSVAHFSVTPSTSRAGGHPDLRVSARLSEPAAIRDFALHLPGGLTASARAIPFCSRQKLLADFCPRSSKVGSIGAVAVAYGLELPITRELYNVRPRRNERIRLGVPIVASYTGTALAAELPVTERSQDKGLDLRVTGLPSEVAGLSVRLEEISLSIKGTARTRVRRKIRKRAFLTNPTACNTATSVLEMNLYEAAAPVTASSRFTPTGCPVTSPH